MNLKNLTDWTQTMQDVKKLRELVRRDTAGKPRESDVTRALSLVREIRKRITLVEDHQKKATRYMNDITEYLLTLESWGIVYREEILNGPPPPVLPSTGASATNVPVHAPSMQAVEGPSQDPSRKDPTPKPKRKTK